MRSGGGGNERMALGEPSPSSKGRRGLPSGRSKSLEVSEQKKDSCAAKVELGWTMRKVLACGICGNLGEVDYVEAVVAGKGRSQATPKLRDSSLRIVHNFSFLVFFYQSNFGTMDSGGTEGHEIS